MEKIERKRSVNPDVNSRFRSQGNLKRTPRDNCARFEGEPGMYVALDLPEEQEESGKLGITNGGTER